MYTLEELKTESNKLQSLLEDPQQGLMSWNICLMNVLNNIVTMAQVEEADPEADKETE